MPYLPSYLQAADPASQWLKGAQLGAGIAEAKAHLAQQAANAEMESQARQQTQAREYHMEQARIAQQKAYQDSQIGLRAQALNETAKRNALETQKAAALLMEHRGFAQDLQSGMTTEDALVRHPLLATPTAVMGAHKEAADATGRALDLRQRGLELREQEAQARDLRGEKIGTMDIPLPSTDPKALATPLLKGIPLDSPLINQVMGTNAPAGTGTNFMRRARTAAAPAPAATNAPAAAGYPEGTIIRHKGTGKLFQVKDGVPVPYSE